MDTDKKKRGWLLEKAAKAKRESKQLDFKAQLNPDSGSEWCEVVKDIVAMANSGGGVIVFGVDNGGNPSGYNPSSLLSYDPAKVTDKIYGYTGRQYDDIELVEIIRDGNSVAVIVIGEARIPLVFSKIGKYRLPSGVEKIAFQAGTLYFRHGAKSEPATEGDLSAVLERALQRIRGDWFRGIKKVTTAPIGSVVEVASPSGTVGGAHRARIVTDAAAPGVRLDNGDDIFPFRQLDVIRAVNANLGDNRKINSHDIYCLRIVGDLEQNRPEFMWRPFQRSSPQYSRAFVDWLIGEYRKDAGFFEKTREEVKKRGKK